MTEAVSGGDGDGGGGDGDGGGGEGGSEGARVVSVEAHCKDGGDSQTCAAWVRRANHTAPHAGSESDRSHCATFHGLWRARLACETYGLRW